MSQLRGQRLALLGPCHLGALLNMRADDFYFLVNLCARNIAQHGDLIQHVILVLLLCDKAQLHG